jgi:hypothetical protein
MKYNLRCIKRLSLNSLVAILIISIAFSIAGCITSIPATVRFIEKGRQYTATLDVSKEAGEIYHIVVREIEKIPDVTIIKKEDSIFSVEASRAEKITRITASPLGNGKSRVTVRAEADKSWEESRNLANRVVRRICEEVQMRCTLIVE